MTNTLRVSVGLAGAAGVSTGGDAASIQLRRFFCYETHASEEFVHELDSLVTGERQLIHIKVDFFSLVNSSWNQQCNTHSISKEKATAHCTHTDTQTYESSSMEREWRLDSSAEERMLRERGKYTWA